MMRGILEKVFYFKNIEFRTEVINHEIWFLADDVCKFLRLSSPNLAIDTLNKKYVYSKEMSTKKGIHKINYINELGINDLICLSSISNAKDFKKWISYEVLPSIERVSVSYVYYESKAPDDVILKAKSGLNDQITKGYETMGLKKIIEKEYEDIPCVLKYKKYISPNELFLIWQVAKVFSNDILFKFGFHVKQNNLFKLLISHYYLIKSNEPNKENINKKYIDIEFTKSLICDEEWTSLMVMLTKKELETIYKNSDELQADDTK